MNAFYDDFVCERKIWRKRVRVLCAHVHYKTLSLSFINVCYTKRTPIRVLEHHKLPWNLISITRNMRLYRCTFFKMYVVHITRLFNEQLHLTISSFLISYYSRFVKYWSVGWWNMTDRFCLWCLHYFGKLPLHLKINDQIAITKKKKLWAAPNSHKSSSWNNNLNAICNYYRYYYYSKKNEPPAELDSTHGL